ncbi:Vitamin B12 import system permease protein BtuC [Dermatophilus congolensis]|uniref:Vitamin B12 import system permease protein BtuC n=1 Tax=Dermatophilus congolensis TaxID=1863 RepID=A0AA46BMF7_9MICO|nr:iron chelate uptake ABC transporter family permease subunit [Dermatophilus congolensis]STD07247.1 Vitamin B12 import system permease protein BtuC [Dermatophilus congolensis]
MFAGIPGVGSGSELADPVADLLWQIRFPRTVLALMVGASLSLAGASYQGVFHNPLADPYLLGASAGGRCGCCARAWVWCAVHGGAF